MSAFRRWARRAAAGWPGRAAERLLGREPAVALLLYHRIVARLGANPFSLEVTEGSFRAQLAWLAGRYPVLPLADLLAALDRGALPPGRSVCITFDDGYRDNRSRALPVLEALGLPATLFLATGYTGSGRPFWWDRLMRGDSGARDDAIYERLQALSPTERDRRIGERVAALPSFEADELPLDADEVRALGPRFAVAGHGHDHLSLGRASPDLASQDLARCAEFLAREVPGHLPALAYPFGRGADVTAEVVAAARRAGFRAGFTTEPGVVRAGADPMRLPRLWAHDGPADRLATALLRAFAGRAG